MILTFSLPLSDRYLWLRTATAQCNHITYSGGHYRLHVINQIPDKPTYYRLRGLLVGHGVIIEENETYTN